MRKLILAILLFVLFIGGFFVFTAYKVFEKATNNISVNIRENDNTFQFSASYDRYKTRHIQRYLDHVLNDDKNFFRNAKIDGDVKLDNSMLMYVKCRPGKLVIKMDKTKNDSASYIRLKELAEELKGRIAENVD